MSARPAAAPEGALAPAQSTAFEEHSTAPSLLPANICSFIFPSPFWDCPAAGKLSAAPGEGPPGSGGRGARLGCPQRAERATQRSVKSVAAPQRCLPMATQGCPPATLGSPAGSKSFMSTLSRCSFASSLLSVLRVQRRKFHMRSGTDHFFSCFHITSSWLLLFCTLQSRWSMHRYGPPEGITVWKNVALLALTCGLWVMALVMR